MIKIGTNIKKKSWIGIWATTAYIHFLIRIVIALDGSQEDMMSYLV